jgi:hypothetical protein
MALRLAALAALALLATAPRAAAKRVWPEMHSPPESLLAPNDLYENARPFRWAGQRRTDSVRVAIVVHRWDSFAVGTADRWDSTEVWVMRGDAFGPVNPFIPGRRDPFLVRRLLPRGRLALRCQIGLIEPPPDGRLSQAPPVHDFVLGRGRLRLMTPTIDGGSEIILRTVPGHARPRP